MTILASESPRRRELIKKITQEFTVIPANIVFQKHPNDKVLACDTVVIIDGQILGKPHSKEQASEMLHKLSGRKHVVISGYTIISKEKEVTRTVRTYVYFNKLSDELIDRYIASGSPMDKAGAYGIQDEEFHLVDHIEGSMDNVVGLPTEDIKAHWF